MKNDLRTLDSARTWVSPSLLAADFAMLLPDIQAVETADARLLHLDVMDGHFVPNISFGPCVVQAIRRKSNLLFDTHLMIAHPRTYITPFAQAGADHITFHIECNDDPYTVIETIRANDCTVGISLKPQTDPAVLLPFLSLIDMVLVMTVEPGFGGQSFMRDQMEKVRFLRRAIDVLPRRIHLEVDGGIDAVTAPEAKEAGANVLVAGTAVFRAKNGIAPAIEVLRA